jgi:hypothetical protein
MAPIPIDWRQKLPQLASDDALGGIIPVKPAALPRLPWQVLRLLYDQAESRY